MKIDIRILALAIASLFSLCLTAAASNISENPFGIAFGSEQVIQYYGVGAGEKVRAAGATDYGIHLFWSSVEPINNVYNPTILNTYLAEIQPGDNAYIIVFTDADWCIMYGNESWLTWRYKGMPLANESCKQEYRQFIRDLVNYTNGSIMYWQRDIEPATTLHWPANYSTEYVELQQIFYEEVKAQLPDAQVGGLGIARIHFWEDQDQIDFYTNFFDNASDYFDYLDIHLYQDKYDLAQAGGIKTIVDAMNGYASTPKPLIVEEAGGPTSFEYTAEYDALAAQCGGYITNCNYSWIEANWESIDPKMQIFFNLSNASQEEKRDRIECHDIPQRYMIAFAEGAEKMSWWDLMSYPHDELGVNPTFGKLKLLESNLSERSSYYCYQRMVNLLNGTQTVARLNVSNDSIYLYEANKSDGNTTYVLWHREEGVDSYDAENSTSVIINLNLSFQQVNFTSIFGESWINTTESGNLTFFINNTPLFITQHNSGTLPEYCSQSNWFCKILYDGWNLISSFLTL